MSYIGVYGTLKKGHRANDLLENSDFIGTFKEAIPFQMYNLGAYPALIKDSVNNIITLEVYKVEDPVTLQRLDRYEGYPSLYQKSHINVENMDVIIYTMEDKEYVNDSLIVKSGNWK